MEGSAPRSKGYHAVLDFLARRHIRRREYTVKFYAGTPDEYPDCTLIMQAAFDDQLCSGFLIAEFLVALRVYTDFALNACHQDGRS